MLMNVATQALDSKMLQMFETGNPLVPERAQGPVDYTQPLKVYAIPGCSACLRTKEFLTRHGVPFVAVNPLVDKEEFEALAAIGVKRIPIAARGRHWADGQVLKDLAWIAGIDLPPPKQLPPQELARRAQRVTSVARLAAGRIPEHEFDVLLPDRPRSYKQLACHIFQIYEMFLELAEEGKRFEFASYFRDVPPQVVTSADVQNFGAAMLARFNAWWERDGKTADFRAPADVYYGDQTLQSLHDFFERTVWHSAHHTRQLQVVVQNLGLPLDDRLSEADLAGLPLPENTYDDKVRLS
jgi:hypothetical protein